MTSAREQLAAIVAAGHDPATAHLLMSRFTQEAHDEERGRTTLSPIAHTTAVIDGQEQRVPIYQGDRHV